MASAGLIQFSFFSKALKKNYFPKFKVMLVQAPDLKFTIFDFSPSAPLHHISIPNIAPTFCQYGEHHF